ncbi:putative SP-containing membrane protein [Vairimorpha necatrix]|uniref:SP-containing membrane protein n=1 Tax=Vairimorpha necatrix TaxID=6039 RepID=A0AAX4JG88_9MICR
MIKQQFFIPTIAFFCMKNFIKTIEIAKETSEMIDQTLDTYSSNFVKKHDNINELKYIDHSGICFEKDIEKTNNISVSKILNDLQNENSIFGSPYENLNDKKTNNIDFYVLKYVCNKFFHLLLLEKPFYSRLPKFYLARENTTIFPEEMEVIFYNAVKNHACGEELLSSVKDSAYEYLNPFVIESLELIYILSSNEFQKLFLKPFELDRIWSDIAKCFDLKYSTNEKGKLETMFESIKYKKILNKLFRLVNKSNDKLNFSNKTRDKKPNFFKHLFATAYGLALLPCASLVPLENNSLPSVKNVNYDANNEIESVSQHSVVINDNFNEIIHNTKYGYNRELELPIDMRDENEEKEYIIGENEYSMTESEDGKTSKTMKKSDKETTGDLNAISSTIENSFDKPSPEEVSSTHYFLSTNKKITNEEDLTVVDNTHASLSPYIEANSKTNNNFNIDLPFTITTEVNKMVKNEKNYIDLKESKTKMPAKGKERSKRAPKGYRYKFKFKPKFKPSKPAKTGGSNLKPSKNGGKSEGIPKPTKNGGKSESKPSKGGKAGKGLFKKGGKKLKNPFKMPDFNLKEFFSRIFELIKSGWYIVLPIIGIIISIIGALCRFFGKKLFKCCCCKKKKSDEDKEKLIPNEKK